MSLLLPGSVSQITEGLSRLCSPLLRETDDDDDRRGNDGRPGASTPSPSAETQVPPTRVGGISLGLTCGTCGKVFDNASDQRTHFKTDFHRFNVKRSVAGRPPLTEDVLEAIIAAGDDLSSISGSDSEAEDGEESETTSRSGPVDGARSTSFMVFFRYEDEEGEATVFGIPRGVLFPRSYARKGRESREDFESSSRAALARLSRSRGYWVVVMASGGHFAAAVFASKSENARPLLHKTLHRYVVRAKAGGRQAAKDATGKKASSAGASLRRHNERALAEDIQTLLGLTWKEEIAKADRIFLSAPGTHNSNIFFGGKTPIFDSKDERIHAVPFSTRRPTLKETCRIKTLLSSIYDLPPPAPNKRESRQRDLEDLGGPGAGEAPPGARSSGGAAASLESAEREEDVMATESDLHAATRLGDAPRVLSLLEGGADPCLKDLRGRTPYLLAKTKEVRDTYRRFRAKVGEDAFDWKASGVPQALTPELEEHQRKKKAEKDAKRKKEKQKRKSEQAARKAAQAKREQEEEKKRAEEQEKARKREEQRRPKPFDMFSAQRLSRREIMARAAEARMKLSAMGEAASANGGDGGEGPDHRGGGGGGWGSRNFWIFCAALAAFGLGRQTRKKKAEFW